MLHNIPNFENGIKIESVGMYLEEIKRINESHAGESTELFFRGQEVEFWKVEPSIFRDDMLSIEHRLMLSPLQKIPMEFRNMQDTFEIMTKYQHYGMCTRLLDLTTNPLVALYFACKKHGVIEYVNGEEKESMEPFGMIYYMVSYPILADNVSVKIITFLSTRDLEKENDVESILDNMVREGIISDGTRNKWMSENYISKFIEIIQKNYLVMPLYSNERLAKQSGAFLLPGLFGFTKDDDLRRSVITKCKKDLRNEFEETFFYIDGSDKDSILEELNWYNINESTLFPELEHQLNYIKRHNQAYTKPVTDFDKAFYTTVASQQKEIINMSAEMEVVFQKNVRQFILEQLGDELGKSVFDALIDNMIIDWYKRDSAKSKMRMAVATLIINAVDNPKETADSIVDFMVDEYIKLSAC